MRKFRLVIAVCLLALNAFAQDPLKVAPHAYKLAFENDWVKVVRVRYAPREKIVEHDHPKRATIYVYLNDGGPVIFKHTGSIPVTRPATKRGAFRMWPAIVETHEVENTSDLPSEFLRVEMKTEPVGAKTLRGRFPPQPRAANENYQKIEFENEQVRVTRIVVAPRKDVTASAAEPSLWVALSDAKLKVSVKGRALRLSLALGQTRWTEPGVEERIENPGDTEAEFLRFDFKSKPISAQ
ncbi:MAG: hypothetical protein AB1631_04730 [Acidobacteriota bacterium]